MHINGGFQSPVISPNPTSTSSTFISSVTTPLPDFLLWLKCILNPLPISYGGSTSRHVHLFWGSPSKNYTLLSCPVETDVSDHISVGCISNSTHSTLAISSESFAMTMANQTACRIIGPIKSPIAWYQDQGGLTFNLNMDIALAWDNPNCQECVAGGGTCGYTNTTKQEIGCFEESKKRNKHHMIALMIVSIALALPAIAASIALACYICRDRRRVATWVARNARPSAPDTTTGSNGDTVIGLDQSTIESYTKVILWESKRLPGQEDAATSVLDMLSRIQC
ncbi:hypothetical protein M8C21_002463 [Ambrosia artemisiifolia]|uniref:RING-type E3 ubiquitin transferase n=1 Tax=Ambrosia artemisiifolia TaxID=4212 RepID=A0AAD5CJB4_AMBAR|nr:hypothetical protein M8C21_002463 [Ambrosia artemisiifolia]